MFFGKESSRNLDRSGLIKHRFGIVQLGKEYFIAVVILFEKVAESITCTVCYMHYVIQRRFSASLHHLQYANKKGSFK